MVLAQHTSGRVRRLPNHYFLNFFLFRASLTKKNRGKGRKFTKGRPKPSRYTSLLSDHTQSDDLGLTCSVATGLTCKNDLQRGRKICQDYAIRVLCSCGKSHLLFVLSRVMACLFVDSLYR